MERLEHNLVASVRARTDLRAADAAGIELQPTSQAHSRAAVLMDAIGVGVALDVLNRGSFPLPPRELLAVLHAFDFRRLALDSPAPCLRVSQTDTATGLRPATSSLVARPVSPAMLGSTGETAIRAVHLKHVLRNLIDGIWNR